MDLGTEAQKFVWGGAIPLQIHLDESEVSTLTPPPPLLVLGPRLGYLPLLIPLLKPHFNASLPPGVDTIWFEYKGLPLKWYIQTGVLFDLLCAEPERPWNLTVHFRGYPGELLSPCNGEDSVKWSFINSLKEAAYIINGNCKNIMNMSQSDQVELWRCVTKGNMDGYLRIASKLKLGTIVDECTTRTTSFAVQLQQGVNEFDHVGPSRIGRIPVRLYVRIVEEGHEDLAGMSSVDSWDKISYLNKPVEIHKTEGKYLTLHDALKALLPELFMDKSSDEPEDLHGPAESASNSGLSENVSNTRSEGAIETSDGQPSVCSTKKSTVKLIRIQGIEPRLDLPFSWVVTNLMNPEFYLHICVYVEIFSTAQTEAS